MDKAMRWLFFALFVRPAIWLLLGLNIRSQDRLPQKGPAIVVANHNSHLDTPVLITLLPLRLLPKIRPVAAAGYFLKNRWLAWFATKIIGIIPIALGTGKPKEEVLAEAIQALQNDSILILFPEGTRGEPEQFGRFKSGVAALAEMFPAVPVVPVFLHGLGKALPRGEAMLVPFFCDGFVGKPVYWNGEKNAFMQTLSERFVALSKTGQFAEWT